MPSLNMLAASGGGIIHQFIAMSQFLEEKPCYCAWLIIVV